MLSWPEVRQENPYIDELTHLPVPQLIKTVHQKDYAGETLSAGVFNWKGRDAFMAWGRKTDIVCGQHRIIFPNGEWSEVLPGCPDFKLVREAERIAGFSLAVSGGTYIWSDQVLFVPGAARESISEKIKTFLPLIAAFAVILLFTLGVGWWLGYASLHSYMNLFMAGFFLLFGLLKITSLKNFASLYTTYDILAKRSRGYAYLYPFLELLLGTFYLFGLFPITTNAVTALLMGLGFIGVYQALREGRQLRCACLGGFFSLPLTQVTLTENALMGGMATLMLLSLFGIHIPFLSLH